MKRYKLKLTSLKFISPVDTPAQETAAALLLKRAGVSKGTARVVKLDDELGLVFCWAFTSKAAGSDYFDLQGDAIDGDFVKVCAEFMEGARAVDEMHDGEQTGQVVFGMPMTAEVAKAFGVETDTEGFMVAIKPAADVFAKFKSGEYTGVSIEGTGIREEVDKPIGKAVWTTAYVNDLPDSAFLYVEPGGEKDEDGKTTPRTLRHFPIKDASGTLDLPHLRNAISRIPQSKLSSSLKERLQSRAQRMLETKSKKRAVLTTATGGHTHMIHGVDEMMCGNTDSALLPDVGEYGRYHSHPWVRNEDGSIAIGEQEGHTHEVAMLSSSEKRAPAGPADGISTTAQPSPMVKATTPQEPAMDPKDKQIADLSQRTTLLMKMLATALVLPEAHRAHAATLDDQEREVFLTKSAGDRETIVKAAGDADPVLYTRTDGSVIRKSHGQMLADVAKQADQAMALAAAEVSKREQVELQKRADAQLSHFAKGVVARAAILKAVDGIADEALRKEAHEALAGANAAMKELGKPQGANPGVDLGGDDDVTAKRAELRKAVDAFAAANGGLPYEAAFVKAIKADNKIRDLYEQVRAASN